MAILPNDKTKKQKYLGIVLVMIIVFGIFVIWYNFFSQPDFLPSTLPPQKPEEIIIKFEFLEDAVIETLQPFPEILPFEGEVGRENPFVSYE